MHDALALQTTAIRRREQVMQCCGDWFDGSGSIIRGTDAGVAEQFWQISSGAGGNIRTRNYEKIDVNIECRD